MKLQQSELAKGIFVLSAFSFLFDCQATKLYYYNGFINYSAKSQQ